MVADVNITSNENQSAYLAPEKPVWSAETPGMVSGKGAEVQPLYYQMIIYQDGTRVSSNKLGQKSGEWESTLEFRKAFLKSGTYTAQLLGYETDSYTDAVIESELSDSYEYVLPDSDARYYDERELAGLTASELRLARNEILARHGRKFKDTELQDYFNSKSWYRGIIEPDNFDFSVLNKYEVSNIEVIKKLENG